MRCKFIKLHKATVDSGLGDQFLQSFCDGSDVKLADSEDIPSDQLAPGGCDKDVAHVNYAS